MTPGTAEARGQWFTLANAITAVRLPLAPLCAWSILDGSVVTAFVCFGFAVSGDFFDGRGTRSAGEMLRLGGPLHHLSDALFASAACAALLALVGSPRPVH